VTDDHEKSEGGEQDDSYDQGKIASEVSHPSTSFDS
jgi:hypothetical protein